MDEQQRISSGASSSNSSSMLSSKKYDVFLSFRGEDTRLNFTSHLHKALNKKKVETYIDNRLEKGDEISTALAKAIKDSRVSIVIFSKNYASSKWCLGELSKILECKKVQEQIVIPVFYDIDPSHVRKQTGSYGQAFAKHEGDPRCNKWRDDLTEAANLAGWDSRNRTEPEFLEDIVQDVLRKLAPKYPNQRKGQVGIEKSYEKIELSLKIGLDEVKTLGLWGMGGIGKTTLATALYDKLSYEFEGRCFLANVREKSDKLEALRDELFSKLFGNKNYSFDTYEMSNLLRCKKVFIVLDDVATSEQLEKLIVEYDFLGPGSRVIVTTRNKQILRPGSEIYQVQHLSSDHSLQLFCLSAFGEKQPKDGYEDLSRAAICYCKGIPLALKVLGASLCNRSKEAWKSALGKLQKIPNMQIYDALKLSYDGLDDDEKNIFLDIACFFKGRKRDWVTGLLEAFGFFPECGIEVLLDKALITISEKNKIEMHDLIQDMGREIVHRESIKDPRRRSRLWKHEEVLDVLKLKYEGTNVVEGIILDLHKLNADLYLSSDSLAKMTKMRFLKIHNDYWNNNSFNVNLPNGLESLSDKLSYLEWYGCCLESLPPNFCVEMLVEIRMPCSKLKKLWDGVQNLVNLKKIELCYSLDLIEIPDLSKAENLETIYLMNCESLHELHPSVLSHPKLTYLNLCGCTEIGSLNVHAKNLSDLFLNECSSLKEISVTSDKITKLDLSNCSWIESLDLHSKSLRVLALEGCFSLKKISVTSEEMTALDLSDTAICTFSASMLSLPKLSYLYVSDCIEIESLNVDLKYLDELHLSDCSSLKEISVISEEMIELNLSGTAIRALPSWIGYLLTLELLDLSGSKVESLDENIKNLPMLRILWLDNCRNLVSLPELPPSLDEVTAYNCISLETEITQQLVLQHMLQSSVPKLHIIFPGDHVTDKGGFCTRESSITIPCLPTFQLCGFICCIILSKGLVSRNIVVSIYQDDIKVGWDRSNKHDTYLKRSISDHMIFWYHDVSKLVKSEVYDVFSGITFIFEDGGDEERIKGCGVFPVYFSESGLKLVFSNSKEILEWESIIRTIEVGVGSSNNEHEDDPEHLIPT